MTKPAIERLREGVEDSVDGVLEAGIRLAEGLVAEGGREIVAQLLCEADQGGPLGYFPSGTPMRDSTWEDYDERQHDEWRRWADAILEHFAAMALEE